MKRTLLSIGFWLGLTTLAAAQCAQVSGINSVPVPGITCASEPIVTTYAATSVGLVPVAAGPTDMACITGSATKTVRVQYVGVSGSGTAISIPILLMKRASANTGAASALTTAIPVPYPLDSTNTAASATTQAWITANPTIVDTSPGIVDSAILGLVATTVGAGVSPGVVFNYTNRNFNQAVVLRGIAQQLCVNGNTVAQTSLLNITFRWTEAAQ